MTKKRWLSLVTFFVILGVGGGLYAWWHSQATTDVVSYGQTEGAVLGSETSLVEWQTAYFSTRVSGTLRQISSKETADSPIIGSYLFTSKESNDTSQLAITVGKLGAYSLDELSAVKLRLSEPSGYTKTTRAYTPAGGIVFSGNPGYETAMFWQHNDDYVAVVVSGTTDHGPDLEQTLSDIVRNLQWK